MNKKIQSGFTLIELVIVIIILGILSVTAAPKFLDLQGDAKASTLDAIAGAMKAASDTIYAKSLIAGTDGLSSSTVSLSNLNTVAVNYGYPAHDWTTAWIEMLDADVGDGNGSGTACTQDFCYDTSHNIAADFTEAYPTATPALTSGNADANTAVIIFPKGKIYTDKCYAYYAYDQGQASGSFDKPQIGVITTGC